MSYLRLADLAQTPAATVPTPVAPAAQEFSTGQAVTGIVGALLSAGATIGVGLINADTQKKLARDQQKADMQIEAIRQQTAAQQALLAASMPPPPPQPAISGTAIAILGGVGLLAVGGLAIALASGGKRKRRREDDRPQMAGWGGPWGPPPGWGAPPMTMPPMPLPPPPPASNPRRKGKK